MNKKSFFDTKVNSSMDNKKYAVIASVPIIGLSVGSVFTYDPVTKEAILKDQTVISNLDVTNKTYFREAISKYEVGTPVLYCDKLYVVNDISVVTGRCILKDYYSNVYKENVNQDNLKKAKLYWFVNSEGKICMTFIGKNSSADRWRKKSHNMFDTQNEASDYIKAILA